MSMKIITRQDARDLSLHRYYTGKPCKWGHITYRNTYSGSCRGCEKARHDSSIPRVLQGKEEDYLVHGIGYNDAKEKGLRGHPLCQEARVKWKSLLERCSEKYWGDNENYRGTSVCEEWKTFSNFFNWYVENRVHPSDQIDKDIIGRHSEYKTYGPDTCLMVTPEVNAQMWMNTTSKKFSKEYIGSYSLVDSYKPKKRKTKPWRYAAMLWDKKEGKRIDLGYCYTQYEAHCAWRLAKIDKFLELSKKYQDSYPKVCDYLKGIALEMSIDAALDRPTVFYEGWNE